MHTIIPGRRQDGTRKGPPAPAVQVAAAPDCPRQNQKNLTPAARKKLFDRISAYIKSPADPVRQHLEQGHVHGRPEFLAWHRGFLRGFEDWQRAQARKSNDDFVPLAFWDTADSIPKEFPHDGRNESIPPLPIPEELKLGNGLEKLNFTDFRNKLEQHHNEAHDAIGGDMQNPEVSPRDPLFWIFHAFYDHIYSDWLSVHPGGEAEALRAVLAAERGRTLTAAAEAVTQNDATSDVKDELSQLSPNHPAVDAINDDWIIGGPELLLTPTGKSRLKRNLEDDIIRDKFGNASGKLRQREVDGSVSELISAVNRLIN